MLCTSRCRPFSIKSCIVSRHSTSWVARESSTCAIRVPCMTTGRVREKAMQGGVGSPFQIRIMYLTICPICMLGSITRQVSCSMHLHCWTQSWLFIWQAGPKAPDTLHGCREPEQAHVRAPDVVQPLLVLASDGLALAVDLGVGRDDAVRLRLRLHHLELHAAHAAAHQEGVVLRGARKPLEILLRIALWDWCLPTRTRKVWSCNAHTCACPSGRQALYNLPCASPQHFYSGATGIRLLCLIWACAWAVEPQNQLCDAAAMHRLLYPVAHMRVGCTRAWLAAECNPIHALNDSNWAMWATRGTPSSFQVWCAACCSQARHLTACGGGCKNNAAWMWGMRAPCARACRPPGSRASGRRQRDSRLRPRSCRRWAARGCACRTSRPCTARQTAAENHLSLPLLHLSLCEIPP